MVVKTKKKLKRAIWNPKVEQWLQKAKWWPKQKKKLKGEQHKLK